MGNKFAKLFDLPDGSQILVTLDIDGYSDDHKVCQRTDMDGLTCNVDIGFATEEKAQACFDEYGQEQAEALKQTIFDLMKSEEHE